MAKETNLRLSFKDNSESHTAELDHRTSGYHLPSGSYRSRTHYQWHNQGVTAMAVGFRTNSYLLQSKPAHPMSRPTPPPLTATNLVTGQWGWLLDRRCHRKAQPLHTMLACTGNRLLLCSFGSASHHWLSLRELWDPAAWNLGDFPASAESAGTLKGW